MTEDALRHFTLLPDRLLELQGISTTEMTQVAVGAAHSILQSPAHHFWRETLFVNCSFILIYVRQIFDFLLFRSNKMHQGTWEKREDDGSGAGKRCAVLREWE